MKKETPNDTVYIPFFFFHSPLFKPVIIQYFHNFMHTIICKKLSSFNFVPFSSFFGNYKINEKKK